MWYVDHDLLGGASYIVKVFQRFDYGVSLAAAHFRIVSCTIFGKTAIVGNMTLAHIETPILGKSRHDGCLIMVVIS